MLDTEDKEVKGRYHLDVVCFRLSHVWEELVPRVGKVKSTWVVAFRGLRYCLGRKGQTIQSKQQK